MTKEQEAIEIQLLKDFTKIDFSNPLGWTGYYDTELKELSKAIETVLNMLKEKENEIEKKDKVINLMADFINKTGGGKRAFSCMFIENDECNENGCRYCIRQYFKELAERKSEEC